MKTSYQPIEDYAAIGDCRCLGLVSRSGSLDWLCMPRFDSPAIFSAILDDERGGSFVVRPTAPYISSRQYIENTNILKTTFTTSSGEISLTDLMPVRSRNEYRKTLRPERQVLRIIECVTGEVEIEVHCEPRPQFGQHPAYFRRRERLGFCYEHGGHIFNLMSDFPLRLGSEGTNCSGSVCLKQGQRYGFSLSYSEKNIAVIPPLEHTYLEQQLQESVQWWQRWAGRCTYEGPYQKEVVRSLLALKLLTYAPSGAVIAAPTSSLPEIIGGSRNWDYRYCWLRDAAMSLRAFLYLGYSEEAEAFLSWLLHSTKLSRPLLRVVYSIYGETHLKERELKHLDGYRSSRPVRIGNGASDQLQLDIYGEVIQAAYDMAQKMESFDRATRKMLVSLGDMVCQKWRNPDPGIWEARTEPRQNTHSKAMCWVALDRLIELHESGHLKIPLERFRKERQNIRRAIEQNGYDKSMNSYTSTFDSRSVDASLLLLPLYRFIDADDPKMRGTYDQILSTLGQNGLFYRFPFGYDGIEEKEGTFSIFIFLAAGILAQRGDLEEARTVFERGLSYANDVGLFAEEIDPDSGSALGNFPQAYTHVGLINGALFLAETDKHNDVKG
jgi:GH15 family glucan-1,4-alpha-glucosidase